MVIRGAPRLSDQSFWIRKVLRKLLFLLFTDKRYTKFPLGSGAVKCCNFIFIDAWNDFDILISSCYRAVSSIIWEKISEFLISCNLFSKKIAKYDKWEKYLPLLHKAACDNYFIVKCLLKSNVARALILTNCIKLV